MSDHINSAPTVRFDLQGLRAIAVTVVFLAHAGMAGFSGGYIGVDLFFVLSGFLITSALYKEYEETGRINIISFYSRRLKRLLPAMVIMTITTLIITFILLPSFQAKTQIGSAPFASLWISNFYFTFTEIDYFNELEANDLFLHTWSLGVEEQFYIVWPLLLLFIVRFEQRNFFDKYDVTLRLFAGLCLVFFMSLALNLYWMKESPLLAFYQMPSRGWQFAVGALTFFTFQRLKAQRNRPSRPATGIFLLIAGTVTIAACVYLYNDRMPYPGWAALLPSFSAALIILAGFLIPEGRNPLTFRPLIWLGNRSYSLYLWHWPVLTLAKAVNGSISTELMAISITISLILTGITYRWVEIPFWKGSLSYFTPKLVIPFGTLIIILSLLGSFHAARKPILDETTKNEYVSQQARYDYPVIYNMPCDAWYKHDKVQPCVFGPKDARKTVVLLGDSIGAQWLSLIGSSYLPRDWRMVVLTKSSCPMVDHPYFYERIKQVFSICDSWRDKVLNSLPKWEPEVVIVGSASTYPYSNEEWVSGSQRVWKRIRDTGAHVIVLPGTPTLDIDAPSCISREIQNRKADIARACSSNESEDVAYRVSTLLRDAASSMQKVDVLDLNPWVCPSRNCYALTKEGIVVFRDSKHLTDGFVNSIIPKVAPQLITTSKEQTSH